MDAEADDQSQIMRGKRSKRSRLSILTTSSAASGCSFYDHSEEDEDMANCLIMLAQSGRFQKPKIKVQKPEFYVYECKTCNRSFPSFQALGGHRASHKKHKTAQEKQIVICQDLQDEESHLVSLRNSGPKVHECSICGSEFASGQALGGHMRRHRSISTTPNATTETNIVTGDDNTRNVMQLDLNLPAPENHRQDSKFRILDFNLAPALVDCRY